MSKIDEFKQELRALLAKYDAYICCGVGEGSDTYGIYDEHICVMVKDGNKEVESKIDGWGIGASDILM